MLKKSFFERQVSKGLTKAYEQAKETKIPLDVKKDKVIIFSDLHRGIRDGADDFKRCEKNYNAALGFYYESGYKLIILGDAEDLWECWTGKVMRSYADSLALENEFSISNTDRYIRISGNHDDLWGHKDAVKKYFSSINFNPVPEFHSGVILEIRNPKKIKNLKEIFLTHGHQGTLTSDLAAPLAKLAVRYVWRNIQRLTGIKLTTPAKDIDKLHKHDKAMYEWAASYNGNLYLIAGHTHSPLFSYAQISKIEASLKAAVKSGRTAESARQRAYMEYYNTMYSDFKKINKQFVACYFNTGCCSFSDGDITGIEIADGKMMLVRWPDDTGKPKKKVLDEFEL